MFERGNGLTCKAVLIVKPTIKPTRCTNFSNLFLQQKYTCFGQFLCSSSGVFHCAHCNGICHTDLLTACEQQQNGTVLILLSSSPKHVEFYSKNKFEKLVHLVGFIIRIYQDARSPERRNVKLCQLVSSYRRFGGPYKSFDFSTTQKK